MLNDLQELQVKADQTSIQTVSLQQSVQETEQTKAELQAYIDDLQAKHDNLNRINTELFEKYDVVVEEKLTLSNKIEEVRCICIKSTTPYVLIFSVYIYSWKMLRRNWSTKKKRLPLKSKRSKEI